MSENGAPNSSATNDNSTPSESNDDIIYAAPPQAPSIGISIISNRNLSPYFSQCLNSLTRYLADSGIKYSMHHRTNVGMPSEGMQQNVDDILAAGHTHVLFIEDDMLFPPDAANRLLAYDHPAIGVNYPRKTPELVPTAFSLDGKLLEPKTGTESVLSCGMGFLLVETALIKDLPAPHFEVRYNDVLNCYVSPDVYFCRLIRAWDIDILVDHDLSYEIGHVGEYVYSFAGR